MFIRVLSRMVLLVAFFVVSLSLQGCDVSDGGGGGGGGGGGLTPDLPPGWSMITPGGDTTCTNGSTYQFFARRGSVNRLLVFFEGGGACWNQLTCSLPIGPRHKVGVYTESVPQNVDDFLKVYVKGIFDFSKAENPFKHWYYVFIPYCSADVHIGDSFVEYEEPILEIKTTIQHRGQKNVTSALDWIYKGFKKPEKILAAGCSAGSVGCIGWAPYIMDHFSESENYQLGDSFVGVMTEGLFTEALPSWDIWGLFSGSPVPGLTKPDLIAHKDTMMAYVYIKSAEHFTTNTFSQYNSEYDQVQTAFYELSEGQGGVKEWSKKMNLYIDDIHKEVTSNFVSFIGAGKQHCYLPDDDFYQKTTDGVKLRDWVADIVNDDSPDKKVDCKNSTEGCGAS